MSTTFIPGIYVPRWLEVYAGPMRSSKSEVLKTRFARLEHTNIDYKIFQPAVNNRDNGNEIRTRNGSSFAATKIASPEEVFAYLSDNMKVVGFEEAQFFEKSIERVVEQLLLQDRNVIIAGLDMDAERRPFGSMDFFLREADYVEKLHAVCEDCRDLPAKYSFFKGGKQQQIAVGDDEYKVLCRSCYEQATK